MHAEQSATHHAISSGEGIVKIGINAAPCGYCRQFLSELHNAVNVTVVVHGPNTGKVYTGLVEIPVADVAGGNVMLPYYFGPSQLGQTTGMDDTAAWIISGFMTSDPLTNVTAEAARTSYAPYSLIPAAVGIAFPDGTWHVGLYLENAAYNPSLEPIVSAINLAILHNKDPRDLTDVVLVQADCCDKPTPAGHPKYPSIDHTFWSQTVLAQVTKVPLRVVKVKMTRPE
jgi:cytidine deaminase